jgi:acyl-coenzyme A thioesterase PaaI-like protein
MGKTNEDVSLRKMRWMLFLLGIMKIPMIRFVRPKLIVLNDEEAAIRIKLRRRTRNHLKSMYFGALAVGADTTAGVHAFHFAEKMGKKVSFAFKGMTADFLMRGESDITFKSSQGKLVEACMIKSFENQERVNQVIEVLAFDVNQEIVAKFEMIISVRVK